jgi:hypothetical protein
VSSGASRARRPAGASLRDLRTRLIRAMCASGAALGGGVNAWIRESCSHI